MLNYTYDVHQISSAELCPLGVQIKGEWYTERRKAFEEVITDLGLTDLLEGYLHELSGE